ncbi:predicted protein, partial [Nematostella vectensis]
IPDARMTASSYYTDGYEPRNGRLNNEFVNYTVNRGMWTAKHKAVGEYLQVDVGRLVGVTKVATQGRPSTVYIQYVTSYKIGYSSDLINWIIYREGGIRNFYIFQVFPGNKDVSSPVYNHFTAPLPARGVRFIAQTWNLDISMRVELYGCG